MTETVVVWWRHGVEHRTVCASPREAFEDFRQDEEMGELSVDRLEVDGEDRDWADYAPFTQDEWDPRPFLGPYGLDRPHGTLRMVHVAGDRQGSLYGLCPHCGERPLEIVADVEPGEEYVFGGGWMSTRGPDRVVGLDLKPCGHRVSRYEFIVVDPSPAGALLAAAFACLGLPR